MNDWKYVLYVTDESKYRTRALWLTKDIAVEASWIKTTGSRFTLAIL